MTKIVIDLTRVKWARFSVLTTAEAEAFGSSQAKVSGHAEVVEVSGSATAEVYGSVTPVTYN